MNCKCGKVWNKKNNSSRMLLVSVIDNNKSIAKEIARMCTCRVNRENETDYNAECKN